MAGTSLLALLDDIASLLDDVSLLTKAATKKTAGVLGDDLALNAEQVTGVRPDRELPVVWAVAKGSALNKVILVPTALTMSALIPWIITPLLMFGGAFLCFEGFEKVAHKFLHAPPKGAPGEKLRALSDPAIDIVALEKAKIKGAIRTDFILSAEIIVIALGTVQSAPFWTRSAAITAVATLVTVGVYLLVAAIVKMDDAGLSLAQTEEDSPLAIPRKRLGISLLWVAPRFLALLSFLGTIAMFLVGGGILAHGTPPVHHLIHGAESAAASLPTIGVVLGAVVPTALTGLLGVLAGALAAGALALLSRARSKPASPPPTQL